MTRVTKEHCLEIVTKFEPCPENQKQGVLGIDGKMRSGFFLREHFNNIDDHKVS